MSVGCAYQMQSLYSSPLLETIEFLGFINNLHLDVVIFIFLLMSY